jgi:formylglycine-generating enzyme required for sulfatase activity
MASAITLTGIDRAISHLKDNNENTLKYRYIRHIRQYYADDKSVDSLKAIDHTSLIQLLWNTGDDPEAIKNKRKNLNGLRSSVNADLKKLYEKGINIEGIKISSDNIFVMSEDAKDNILNRLGYELQPDGTLKLDQIMDILKLTYETVSDSMAVENNERTDGLSKKDQLKDLIKGLSEKLGLGAPEFSKTGAASEGQQSEEPVFPDNIDRTAGVEVVDEDDVLSEVEAIEEDFEEEEVLEEVDDIKEDEISDEIEEVEEDILDGLEGSDSEAIGLAEEIDEDPEDALGDAGTAIGFVDVSEDDGSGSVDGIGAEGTGVGIDATGKGDEDGSGFEEENEILEDKADDEDAELEVVDVIEDAGSGSVDGVGGEEAAESGTGDKYSQESFGLDRGLGQGAHGNDPEEAGPMTGNSKVGSETGHKGEGTGIGVDATGKGGENGSGFEEENEVFDGAAPEAVDEITELADLDEIEAPDEDDMSVDVDEEILDGVEEVVEEDIEDSDARMASVEEEIDEVLGDGADDEEAELEVVDVVDDEGFGDGISREPADESGTGWEEKHQEIEQLGLPVDSLGEEYGSGKDVKFKKKLLAEAFDGFLGSMDRYYNHYILIDGGQYLIGSRHPKKKEKAEHTVHLGPFYFGRFPVTNGLFEIFVEKTGYKTSAEKVGYGTVYYGRVEKRKDEQTGLIISKWNACLYCKVLEGACWYHPSGPGSTLHNKRNHPVVQISLEDAAAFAAWTGKRLPTEDEWEAASRTKKGWMFPWGNEWKKDAANIEDCGIADTAAVDKYAGFENDFGIVDVLGNVLEWTDNGFGEPYPENKASAHRIAKGGSWVSGTDIRLFSRFILEPGSHSNILGFRCVAY